MIKAGIIGLPNAGKSTFFNAVSGAEALVAPYPFSTIEPNRAIVKVHDPDFEALGAAIDAPDLQYSEMELLDIAGLIKGAHNGEGLGSEFLGQMKDCDALIHVVRVANTTSEEQAREDLQTVNTEVALFDHKLLRKPFEKGRRLVKLYPKDKALTEHDRIVSRAYYATRDGTPIIEVLDDEERQALAEYELVSLKETLVLANTDESAEASAVAKTLGVDVALNALELGELAELAPEDQRELGYSGEEISLALYGLSSAILRATHRKQIFTVGHLGVGQWIASEQATADAYARLIHDALANEVKSVKVAQLEDFKIHKSWTQLARNGLVRMYSANKYVPKNKEVLLFE